MRKACPSAVCVIDTQDLHFIRRQRARALQQGSSTKDLLCSCLITFLLSSGLPLEKVIDVTVPVTCTDMLREISSIHRSDLTLVVSTYEHSLLINKYGISPQKVRCREGNVTCVTTNTNLLIAWGFCFIWWSVSAGSLLLWKPNWTG